MRIWEERNKKAFWEQEKQGGAAQGRRRMWNLTVVLCVIWAATLLYGEMFAYWVPAFLTCSWPHHLRHRSPSSSVTTAYIPLAEDFLFLFLSLHFFCFSPVLDMI